MRRFRAPPDAGNVTLSSLFRQCKVAPALSGQTAHLGLKRQNQAIGSHPRVRGARPEPHPQTPNKRRFPVGCSRTTSTCQHPSFSS